MLCGTYQLAGKQIMRFNLRLAALAATVAFASPALAQEIEPAPTPTPAPAPVATDTATATAKGLVLQPLTLTKVDDLDFGTVLASTVAGSVTIDADTGGRTADGGVTLVASNPGGRGLFTGAGTEGQEVLLTLTPPAQNLLISSTDSDDTILISEMVFDEEDSTTRTIGDGGTFNVGVGATFEIAASQPNGFYRADFDVTADYQ
jgi:hypothetical protein